MVNKKEKKQNADGYCEAIKQYKHSTNSTMSLGQMLRFEKEHENFVEA